MTERDPLYIQDICKSAEMERELLLDLVCEEGVRSFTALRVTQSSPAAMSVTVSAGGAFINNDQDTSAGEGGVYHVYNDAPVPLGVPANNTGSVRVDTVWARVCDSQYAAVTSDWTLVYLPGTTTAPSDGCSYYKLATVNVPNAAVAITGFPTEFGDSDGQIVDERFAVTLCGTGGAPRDTLVFTGDSTFNKANYPWLKAVRVRVVGGGGGGGGCGTPSAGNVTVGAGGGGGGYAEKTFRVDELAGGALAVNVGAGGAGGGVGGSGVAGGSSQFSLVSATGGSGGGAIGAPGSTIPIASGGAGGSGSGGDLNIDGEFGQDSFGFITAGAGRGVIGAGGGTVLGPRSNDGVVGATQGGQNGLVRGGGGEGSAAVNPNPGIAGGNGATGVVIIELFG